MSTFKDTKIHAQFLCHSHKQAQTYATFYLDKGHSLNDLDRQNLLPLSFGVRRLEVDFVRAEDRAKKSPWTCV